MQQRLSWGESNVSSLYRLEKTISRFLFDIFFSKLIFIFESMIWPAVIFVKCWTVFRDREVLFCLYDFSFSHSSVLFSRHDGTITVNCFVYVDNEMDLGQQKLSTASLTWGKVCHGCSRSLLLNDILDDIINCWFKLSLGLLKKWKNELYYLYTSVVKPGFMNSSGPPFLFFLRDFSTRFYEHGEIRIYFLFDNGVLC